MAFCYFNGCQGDAQIWLSIWPRPQCRRTWEGFFDRTSRQQRRFWSRLRPLRRRTFLGFQRKEKEVHWPRDVYSPHRGHFSGFNWGHQIRNSVEIMWGRIRSSLSYPSLLRRILSECHHIPRGWSNYYYQALCAWWDNRPLDCRALLCGCTSWVRSIPLSCGWVLQLPERVGIAYLVCPIPYIACLHFPVYFPKKKKKFFPFLSVWGMNFVIPLSIVH